MKTSLLIRVFFCIFCFVFLLYSYIEKQNAITELRLEIPILSKELRLAQQENIRLQYEIDRFENPVHLMELARHPEYRHLKHPLVSEILFIEDK